MIGFAGWAGSAAQQQDADSAINGMLDAMSHLGPARSCGRRNRFTAGCIASREDEAETPRLDAVDRIWVMADGPAAVSDPPEARAGSPDDRPLAGSATARIRRAYAQWGDQFPRRVAGALAAAVWDDPQGRLLLVRDRLGVKPLYYCAAGGTIYFATEIKALLRHPRVPRRLNKSAVPEYLAYRYVTGRETLFDEIYELEPGSSLEWRQGTLNISRYWDLPYDDAERPLDVATLGARIESRLRDAVEDALNRRWRVGTLLSGGLDSSLLTALASTSGSSTIRTWSIGVEGSGLDETARAEHVATGLGTRHVSRRVNAAEFAAALPWAIWRNDEPLHHPNSVALCVAAREIRADANCLVMGEGADSTFGNRVAWKLHLARALHGASPTGGTGAISALLNASGTAAAQKMAKLLAANPDEYVIASNTFAQPDVVRELMHLEDTRAIFNQRREIWRNSLGNSLISRTLYYYQKTEMLSSFNIFGKMLRGDGIHLCLPFADDGLQELVCRLPASLKVSLRRTKPLLVTIAKRHLTRTVVNRPKMSFAFPIGRWLAPGGALRGYLALLEGSRADQGGMFDKRAFRQIISDHDHGVVDHGEGILWSMINFELWSRIFLNQESPHDIVEQVRARATDDAVPVARP